MSILWKLDLVIPVKIPNTFLMEIDKLFQNYMV